MSLGRDGRRPDSEPQRERKRQKKRKRLEVNDCLEKPAAPAQGVIVWKEEEGQRHWKFTAKCMWEEVLLDVDGLLLREPVKRYWGQFQQRDPQGNVDSDVRKFVVAAHDNDTNDTVQKLMHIGKKKNWEFRFRVRAATGLLSKYDRSAWGPWSEWSKPTKTPLAPTNVRIFDKDNRRVPVDWDTPLDVDDSDLMTVDIDHFVVEWSNSATFATTYKKRRKVTSSRSGVVVPKADLGPFFYARVRSVDAQDFKSAWIPATIAGNSSSGADPDGVKPGRSHRISMTFTKNGVVEAKMYDQGWTADRDWDIVGVRARLGRHTNATHPDDGTPGGSDMQINLRIVDDADDDGNGVGIFTADNRLTIGAGTHKATDWIEEGDSGYNRTFINKNETVFVKVATVGSSRPGSNLVVFLILEAAD